MACLRRGTVLSTLLPALFSQLFQRHILAKKVVVDINPSLTSSCVDDIPKAVAANVAKDAITTIWVVATIPLENVEAAGTIGDEIATALLS
ncbi:hypothetical protein CCP3SC15_1760006 [Gammaproteobacteria bacterium]